ncbi:hypothetical protein [Marivita sp.]|uniref:hypothetical protein n=1 Tax=Marivita sp. TaxID=2003365 RepID=UPI003F7141BB
MSIDTDLLNALELNKGFPPLSDAEFNNRVMSVHRLRWPKAMRDVMPLDPDMQLAYQAWLQEIGPTLRAARAYRPFNDDLDAYRAATARLARVRLSTGREAIYEDQPTGELDEQGQPITESVLVSPAVEPLPAQIEVETRDVDTGEITGVEMVDNPAITQDEAERDQAQAVIDGTPQEVKDHDAE